jgi:nucleotide-binding universal stress UspA family protein
MTYTKILCSTDFSTGSEQALRVAVRMARETGAELVLAHAWYIPPSAYSLEAPFPPYVVQGVVDDSQRALDAAVKEAKAGGAKHVTGKLLTGVPWMQIVGELEKQAYDICIIGTHGRTGLARVLLGSVAEKIVRHAPCSVLAVRPDGDARPFHHVLVPTDFSESATHALDLAATLVEPTGSITVVHVIEVPVAYSGEVPITDFARDLDKRAAAALDKEVERIKRATKVPVTARSRIGYPGAQTLAVLDDDRSIDLVVMGSHGRTGIKRALMGSVAEKVVRHARCPVLVARERA